MKLIQNRLISKGYSVGVSGADGYFGKDTLTAVKKFQEYNGLSDDGIVGENTWRELVR